MLEKRLSRKGLVKLATSKAAKLHKANVRRAAAAAKIKAEKK